MIWTRHKALPGWLDGWHCIHCMENIVLSVLSVLSKPVFSLLSSHFSTFRRQLDVFLLALWSIFLHAPVEHLLNQCGRLPNRLKSRMNQNNTGLLFPTSSTMFHYCVRTLCFVCVFVCLLSGMCVCARKQSTVEVNNEFMWSWRPNRH